MTDELSRRELLQVSAASLVVAAVPAAAAGPAQTTAAKYIVARLKEAGVTHFFGVPGATCDSLFAAAAEGLTVVVTSIDAATLRQNVTSPKGTTYEALHVLMADNGMKPLMIEAVKAAARRSRELAS